MSTAHTAAEWRIVRVAYPSCDAEAFGGFATEKEAEAWAARNIGLLNNARTASWRIERSQS